MAKLIVKEKEKIEAKDHALYFDALAGSNGVLDTGNKLNITVASANTIKLNDGIIQIQGRPYIVYPNEVITLTVENGTQNMKRRDLVIAEFTKTSSAETVQFKVIKGTPTSGNAIDPTLIQQDTLASGTTYQFPLYRVRLNGINIEGTDDLRTYIPSMKKSMQFIRETDDYVEIEFYK